MRTLDKCVSSTHRVRVAAQSNISLTERYRSGHNGADSKSDGRVIPARGFESHPLRHFFSKSFPVLKVVPDFPTAKLLPNYCQTTAKFWGLWGTNHNLWHAICRSIY